WGPSRRVDSAPRPQRGACPLRLPARGGHRPRDADHLSAPASAGSSRAAAGRGRYRVDGIDHTPVGGQPWRHRDEEPLQREPERSSRRTRRRRWAKAAAPRGRHGWPEEPSLHRGCAAHAYLQLRDRGHSGRGPRGVDRGGSGGDRSRGWARRGLAARSVQAPAGPGGRRADTRHLGGGPRHPRPGDADNVGTRTLEGRDGATGTGHADRPAMTASIRTACWLLVAALTAGCASAVAPPEPPAAAGRPGEPGPPRVAVTTDPAPSPVAPVMPAPPPPAPPASSLSGSTTGPDAAVAPTPPETRVPPSAPPGVSLPGTAGPPPERPASRPLVLNFDNADVEIVIQAAAEIVGFNYVLAPTARGRKITVQTVGKISSDEVFAVLLTILDVNGLAAVRSGSLYRIIPREGAPQTPVKTIVGREVSEGLPPDEIVTQIVPLRFINVQDAVTLLRPFVPAQGALAAHRETNLLILSDTAANVRRLLGVLDLVDVEVA